MDHMRITYIGFADFHRYAGMKQLYHFAQEVCRQGHEAQILIAGDANSVQTMEEPPRAEIIEMIFRGPLLAASVRQRVIDFRPDVLHVWTPRHVPALAGWQLHHWTGAPVIIDHEDDEDYYARKTNQYWTMNWQRGTRRLLAPLVVMRDWILTWATPLRNDGSAFRGATAPLSYFLIAQAACAHTAICPNLVSWAQRQWPQKPAFLLYTGADSALFSPQTTEPQLSAQLGLDGRTVLAYSGTASLDIFRWFLAVLGQLVPQWPTVALLLIGEDRFRNEAAQLARQQGLQDHYRFVGQVPYVEVSHYLNLAHILLQHPLDQGNEMRLPAKLPEYLAMGKPIVTYAQGIGETLSDGIHVRKLYTSAPKEAANTITQLLVDPEMCAKLGRAAREIALERFDWAKNSKWLISIYEEHAIRRTSMPHANGTTEG